MTDRRVTMAIDHWAARFVANGVDPADFARVTAGIESWDGWCAAWCAAAAEHEELGRQALGDGRLASGGGHLAQAAVYYHFAKFLFVQDPAQLRQAHGAAVRCLNARCRICARRASGSRSRSTARSSRESCAVRPGPARTRSWC